MLIDTHAHIYLETFEEDLENIVTQAVDAKVTQILMPNIDIHTIDMVKHVATEYPEICKPMMGLHPCSVKEDFKTQLNGIEAELSNGTYIAVGEIGTDLYWDKTFWDQQQKAFQYQVNLAKNLGLPVVIHCRETLDQTIQMVNDLQDGSLTGVFHCFTGTNKQAQQIIDLGFYLGIGGVVTFKNGGLDKVIPEIDLGNFLLETDSPYLAPVPKRGKRNEPSYLNYIATKIAELKHLEKEQVAQVTSNNAIKLFRL